ncbi:MAG: hypothetical protein KDB07_02205 [Planctomycetes bacterium]|nr:hypothetical protein [Planctomycetota bacterium]
MTHGNSKDDDVLDELPDGFEEEPVQLSKFQDWLEDWKYAIRHRIRSRSLQVVLIAAFISAGISLLVAGIWGYWQNVFYIAPGAYFAAGFAADWWRGSSDIAGLKRILLLPALAVLVSNVFLLVAEFGIGVVDVWDKVFGRPTIPTLSVFILISVVLMSLLFTSFGSFAAWFLRDLLSSKRTQ